MLKRIYIDNFRCLVDFDLSFDAVNLFVGRSGTGKSTVFEALSKVAAFASGDKCLSALFQPDDLTHWQQSQVQRFELEIEAPQNPGYGGRYQYELTIHHDRAKQKVQVAAESLWFNNQPLLKVESGKIQWYRDQKEGSISYPASDFSHSALAIYQEDDPKVTWFRERMKRFIIVLILPHLMRGRKRSARSTIKHQNGELCLLVSPHFPESKESPPNHHCPKEALSGTRFLSLLRRWTGSDALFFDQ